MDSYRVLRNTVATLIAAAAITGGSAAPAHSDRERERQEPESGPAIEPAYESPYQPAVYHREWTTSAKPKKPRIRIPTIRNKAIAFRFIVKRAWTVRQYRCLDSLWTRESNWNHRARNSSSGAYGIPQALPAVKMAGAGWDWRSNPVTQIRWGLTYIKGRYGSPCGAWGHFRAHNWY